MKQLLFIVLCVSILMSCTKQSDVNTSNAQSTNADAIIDRYQNEFLIDVGGLEILSPCNGEYISLTGNLQLKINNLTRTNGALNRYTIDWSAVSGTGQTTINTYTVTGYTTEISVVDAEGVATHLMRVKATWRSGSSTFTSTISSRIIFDALGNIIKSKIEDTSGCKQNQ